MLAVTTPPPETPELPHQRLDRLMAKRRLELRIRWATIAEEADISVSTLGAIRRGDNPPSEDSARGLDHALELMPGNIMRIYKGSEDLERIAKPRQTMTTTSDADLTEAFKIARELEAKLERKHGPRTERQVREYRRWKLAMEGLSDALDEPDPDPDHEPQR